ncbi:MAG: 2,3-bisphosphoglycerate-independent phosphoglycerate mutase [Rikenellaceae bacterium]|nr:2,3-bisphosphoglycerate-independent phosphoglycerate mutase [Rikenellaceae bacterium]
MDKKVLLMILDGWGIGNGTKSDVISTIHPAYISAMTEKYPHAQLRTDGENVGLPNGQMGNSEVGHLNIGAGRVVYQDLVKINRACADNSIYENEEIVKAFEYAKTNGVNVHFMGLTSDGGVHSSIEHLYKLAEIAKHYGIENTFVHCFMDGRDTDPKSGKGFIADVEANLAKTTGKIASIIGRYYAMDRDKRWERVKIAYDCLVNGVGDASSDMVEAMQRSYDEGVTDEFVKPIVRIDENGEVIGRIKPNDLVIFYNYRNDRAKEITIVLTQQDMPEEGMHTMPLYYCCMTPYDAKFEGLHILFDKENVRNTIGEYVSSLGLSQLRIAETEKYAHVTFFLNGGRETEFENESRILVASPKVATYDLQPEMSAYEVKDKLVEALGTQKFDFICLNFANGDMVGHTGIYEAIEKAVKAVDECVAEVVETAKANGYEVVMIADHGNADNAVNEDGSPNTAHSLNPVPIVVVSDRVAKVEDGILADVAPTVLKLMGLPQPAEMSGKALVELK